MTTICREDITGPSAWRACAKPDLVVAMSPDHFDRLDRILARLAGRAVYDIRAADFADPLIDELMGRALTAIRDGSGIALLRCPPGRYTEDELTRLYWGFGSCLGTPLSQSVFGDRIGHVRQTANNVLDRGYRSDRELTMHNDSTDVTGLLCLSQAQSGGISQFASCVTIHNEILRTRPDLLPALYRGHPWHRAGEQQPDEPAITPFDVPVFGYVEGRVSGKFLRRFIEMAAEELTGALPADLAEGMAYFEEVAYRPEVMTEFFLDPGEMVFLNNYTILHARTRFSDGVEPHRQRHLLRLWLGVPGLRPVPEGIRGYVGDGIRPRADFATAEAAVG